ncbi:uncharacterized protein IUM83_19456 [Phytophthora cinnamomi]|uniref:uncharacterized protein n=1 Tax=Phytophthora cinnamomi TaxID=4785 RepID=UPI00355AB26D|nr:hypothetical protein IUM83_19451 [Phytophthora cinnamomi]KAG6610416.1 hypothetical protein IUM83_19456 [Phytophthora cinnamomi]
MIMLLSRGQRVATFCVAVLLIYTWPLLSMSNSGDWDFVHIWDDRTNFLDNRVLRDPLSLETLYAMFTMVRLNVYEPLGWMLKLAIVKAVGLDAWWVRLVSVVVHFAAGFVLAKVSAAVLDIDYLLSDLQGPRGRTGLKLQKRKERSSLHLHACCMSAATFMAHPVHVEVVGWPSAQPYTLAALFSYGALLVHRFHAKHSSFCRVVYVCVVVEKCKLDVAHWIRSS